MKTSEAASHKAPALQPSTAAQESTSKKGVDVVKGIQRNAVKISLWKNWGTPTIDGDELESTFYCLDMLEPISSTSSSL